jgi:hypothetical protein
MARSGPFTMTAGGDAVADERAENMTADQSPKQAGTAQAALTRTVRAVTQPGGKDVDWGKVGAVGSIIGAVAVIHIHGLKTRSWRYLHTAAVALAIGAAAAGFLKARYAGASQAPEN